METSTIKNFFKNLFTKKYSFYMVRKADSDIFLTLTSNVAQAEEYIDMYLYFEHFDHFISWSKLHEYDSKDPNTWDTYFMNCISDEESHKYKILKCVYSKDQLATILRLAAGCPPIGCSFNSEQEYNYYIAKVDAATNGSLTQSLKKALEEDLDEEKKDN